MLVRTDSSAIRLKLPKRSANYWLSVGLTVCSDSIALALAGYFGSAVWRMFFNVKAPPIYMQFWPTIFLFPLVFATKGLYPGVGVGPVELLRRLVSGATIIYLMLSAAIFLARGGDLQSRGALFTSWLLSVVALPLMRALANSLFAEKPWFGVPVVILGAGDTAAVLIEKLGECPDLALKPLACLDDDPRKIGYVGDVPVVGPLSSAQALAKFGNVRHAFVAMPGVPHEQLLTLLERCSLVFPHVYLVPNLMELASIPVSPLVVGGVLALELRHNLLFPINGYLKRALDLAMVFALLPLAIPVMLLAALWIFIVSPRNPFFFHERDGEQGRPIRILKLRTMFPNSHDLLDQHLREDAGVRKEWEHYCKLKKDPRILPGVGYFLRRSSLDDLPQLWNVLIGEMSLVGPRPSPGYHMQQFQPVFRDLRTKVRPGLTGLWQISALRKGDLDMQAALDTYYIRNWSLWLDIFI